MSTRCPQYWLVGVYPDEDQSDLMVTHGIWQVWYDESSTEIIKEIGSVKTGDRLAMKAGIRDGEEGRVFSVPYVGVVDYCIHNAVSPSGEGKAVFAVKWIKRADDGEFRFNLPAQRAGFQRITRVKEDYPRRQEMFSI